MSDGPEEPKKLTRKQRVFIDEYLKCWNAAESARRAGYSEKTAYSVGWENLRKPEISEAIKSRLDEVHMSADEVLKLLADMARGDMGDFIDASGVGFCLDLRDAKEQGRTKLIKKIKQKTTTFLAKSESDEDREVHELEIELYDAQAALEKIGKHHKLFTESIEVGGKDGKILTITINREHEKDDNTPPEAA
jgi:phage terminase small subunit